jgi:hypothetical protein
MKISASAQLLKAVFPQTPKPHSLEALPFSDLKKQGRNNESFIWKLLFVLVYQLMSIVETLKAKFKLNE